MVWLVNAGDNAAAQGFRFDQREAEFCVILKQPLACADHHRVNQQAKLID